MSLASPAKSTARTIAPHGGTLVNRFAAPSEIDALRARAASLPSVTLNARQLSDVEMIGIGAFSPLTGFMGSSDYNAVIDTMHLASGLVWPIPVTLATGADEAERLSSAKSWHCVMPTATSSRL